MCKYMTPGEMSSSSVHNGSSGASSRHSSTDEIGCGGDVNIGEANNVEDLVNNLEEKVKRVNKFVHEIKALSPICEDASDDLKERQVRTPRRPLYPDIHQTTGSFIVSWVEP